ncbi:MAG: MotA/TolQ/ExbB proton channel family protein, partial [Rhodoferax sp.]
MGVLALFVRGDLVTRLVTALLLVMSVASWVVILWKTWLLRRASADVGRSTAAFWQSATVEEAR